MSTINALKNEVKELKASINPEHKRHAVIWAFSSGDELHGVYGFHALILENNKPSVQSALSIDWELEELEKAYKEGTVSWQNPCMYTGTNTFKNEAEFRKLYPTLESYREMRRCKCGRHGPEDNQPYGEVLE